MVILAMNELNWPEKQNPIAFLESGTQAAADWIQLLCCSLKFSLTVATPWAPLRRKVTPTI
jgi:hypothetical protein